jgi:hypothetical protein
MPLDHEQALRRHIDHREVGVNALIDHVKKPLGAALLFGVRGLRQDRMAPELTIKCGPEKDTNLHGVKRDFCSGVVPASRRRPGDHDFTMTSATKFVVAKSCPRASNWNN